MKILQIFAWVISLHLIALILIFVMPGCQSTSRNIPTPDATAPARTSAPAMGGTATYTPTPVDAGEMTTYTPPMQSGRAEPTRPGSPNAASVSPSRPVVDDVAPVTTYTVQRGDSLWSISRKHRITVAELAAANKLSTGATLRPGQKLMVPTAPATPKDLTTSAESQTPSERTEPAATTRNADPLKHTVQSGESLGTIARKYQVTVGEIAAANNITDPAKIRAGQQLIIPGFRAVGSRTTGSAATTPAPAPATEQKAAATPTPTEATPKSAPRFQIAPPPPGQDLDAGLDDTATDVPTIKVEDPRPKG